MAIVFNSLAVLLSLAAGWVFYLGCPNQQMFEKRPIRFIPAVVLSLFLVGLGWFVLRQQFSVLSASFTVLALQMLVLGLLPFLARLDRPALVGVAKRQKNITRSSKEGGAKYQADWWLRTVGSLVLSFFLAICLVGLITWWAPGGVTNSFKTQMVMWFVPLVWLVPFSFAYLPRNAKLVVIGFALAAAISFALLSVAKA